MADDLSAYLSQAKDEKLSAVSELDEAKVQELIVLAQKLVDGYKDGKNTSEFWLVSLSTAVGSALAAGVIPLGLPAQIAGAFVVIVPILGFIFWRKELKKEHVTGAVELVKMLKEEAPKA